MPSRWSTDVHNLHWVMPLRPAQACTISTPPGFGQRPTKPAIHKRSWSPLGCAPQARHRPAWSLLGWTTSLRPAKSTIHTCMTLLGHTLRPVQACMISALPVHAPQAWEAGDPLTFMRSARPHSSGLCRPTRSLLGPAPKACQAGEPQAFTIYLH
jgi:hypothetical protein